MNPIKFIVIHTGYDHRLSDILRSKDEGYQPNNEWSDDDRDTLKDILNKYKPVFLPGCDNNPYIPDKDIYDEYLSLSSNTISNGAAVFLFPEGEENLYDIVNMMEELEYCGCFGSIDRLYFRGNGSILVIQMDCESG